MHRVFVCAAMVTLGLTAVSTSTAAAAGHAGGGLARIQHLVVIYEENHSFDNLYGLWPGVDGLAAPASATPNQTQVDQAGAAYACLKQNDPHLTSPSPATCSDPRGFTSAFANEVFPIDNYVPLDQPTRDLVHRYYQEQYQIDGGRMDRFTTGSDAIGLTQGYYNTTNLPIYHYLTDPGAPRSVVADHFFHAAFGGSFLNHMWLVAPQTPVFAGTANDGSGNDLHSVVDANGMPTSYPLYASPLGSAAKDAPLTASCTPPAGRPATPPGVVCGDYAVNTIQPQSQPYSPTSIPSQRLPALHTPNIGDELSADGVSWAWYSGGWDNAAGITTGRSTTTPTTRSSRPADPTCRAR